jgi:hypothetical protein
MRSHQQGIGFRLQRDIRCPTEKKALACLYRQCCGQQGNHDGEDTNPGPGHEANLFDLRPAMAAAISKDTEGRKNRCPDSNHCPDMKSPKLG